MPSICVFVYSAAALLKLFRMWCATNIASWGVWAARPYVSADPTQQPALILLKGPWPALNQETLHLGCLSLFQARLLSSCFPGLVFLIAANNFHNCVPPAHCLWTLSCLNRWRMIFFFSSPVYDTHQGNKGEIKACRIDIIFSHYSIKTNTDVPLIWFHQMSCFIWHCIPALTWNNLILLPWIIPLHWLIFSPGYFSCISLGMASSTSTPLVLNRSAEHLRIPHHFLSDRIKIPECAWLIIFSPLHSVPVK